MPIHDWSRVEAGIFHDFHQAWTIEIRNALNSGQLPAEFFALTDQVIGGPIPDVVTLQSSDADLDKAPSGGIAVAEAPPQAQFMTTAEANIYADRANRIIIRHRLGRVVAVIEIVSPGNKNSRHALKSFTEKAAELLREGINLLVVDLFPPSPRDPQGIHKAIWDELEDDPFELSVGTPLTVAAYFAGTPTAAYVDLLAVGDTIPSSPIFLTPDIYVPAPLEETYQTTWDECPRALKNVVEQPDA